MSKGKLNRFSVGMLGVGLVAGVAIGNHVGEDRSETKVLAAQESAKRARTEALSARSKASEAKKLAESANAETADSLMTANEAIDAAQSSIQASYRHCIELGEAFVNQSVTYSELDKMGTARCGHYEALERMRTQVMQACSDAIAKSNFSKDKTVIRHNSKITLDSAEKHEILPPFKKTCIIDPSITEDRGIPL